MVGGEMGLISPIICVLLVLAVARALKRSVAPERFLAAMLAVTPLVVFVLSAIRRPVELNWPALSIVPAIALLAADPFAPLARRWERIGIALAAAMTLAVYVHALHPILPIDPRTDPVAQAYGWDDLARAIEAENPNAWIAANRYQDAAELAWHLPTHPTVYSLNIAGRHNQYDLWPTLDDVAQRGDSVLLILDAQDTPPPIVSLSQDGSTAVPGALVDMRWNGTGKVVGRRRVWHISWLASFGRSPL
jgi:hypothetical protein